MADLATAVTVIDACGRAGVPSLLKSPPGMGKSSVVRSLATVDQVPCETVLGSLREPADFGGLPVVQADGVVLEPPSWAKRLLAAGRGYLFLDELTTAAPRTQAAMLAVALDRVVGDLRLPVGVRVVAGANPVDSAAGGYELEPPLANRFCHIEFRPTTDEWLDGMTAGWSIPVPSRAVAADPARRIMARSAVTGFVRARPDLLDGMPSSAAEAGGPWPSRRTWAMVAEGLPFVRDDDTSAVHAIVFGLVGEGAGVEFLEWRQRADLPDPAAVTADPALFEWGSARPDRVWAVLAGVVGLATTRGTADSWRAAWGPLVAAAEAGAADVAGAAARGLARSRPAQAAVPRAARKFLPMLRAAGLVEDVAA